MKVIISIMLKNGVLDPQGEAVKSALGSLGFDGVNGARQGKLIELDLANDTDRAHVEEMCKKLLVNEVIESYTVEIH